MPTNDFLFIEGLKGDSKDSKHKDCTDVESYGWGMKQAADPVKMKKGAGETTKHVEFECLNIVKEVDKISPKLAEFCGEGKNIDKVELRLCGTGDAKDAWMTYKLEDVVISDISMGGGGGGAPMETVEFRYVKVTLTHNVAGVIAGGWDLNTNKKV